jgi:hypothetical protein
MNLTIEGIIFWIFGWSVVIGLVVFCFYKILTNKKGNNLSEE